MLLDKIGPAIIMTHSAGGPFGWLVAEIRPNLVKGIVAIEGGGQPFGGANVWGMSTIPVAYDPPVSDPSEIKTKRVESPEPGVNAYHLQEEPARKLKNLQNIPIVIVTAEASFASPGNPGGVAYFKQAGCKAEEMRLVDARHPRQRPHDDGREEQPRGAEADPRVDRQEREREREGVEPEAAGEEEKIRRR